MKKRSQIQKTPATLIGGLSNTLTPIPPEEFPLMSKLPDKAWKSRRYVVQLFHVNNPEYHGLIRLSICRAKQNRGGGWQDGITWDELQQIKQELGFGEYYGIEIFPPDSEVVNVASFRHLWLLPEPLSIGWFKSGKGER